jgi:hypothetical protein
MGILSAYRDMLSSAYRRIMDNGMCLGLYDAYGYSFTLPSVAGQQETTHRVPDVIYASGCRTHGGVNCGKNDVMLMKTGTHGNGVHERHELKLSKRAEQNMSYRGR